MQLDRTRLVKCAGPRAARLDDVDAALAGGRARVHDGDAARQNRPQDAGRGARRQHFDGRGSRPARRSSARPIASIARRAHLRQRSRQVIRQPDPGLQPLQLVGVNRREIHGVAHHAVAQEIADRGRRIETDQFLRLLGRRGDVRRRDDLRQFGERPIGRRLRSRTRPARRRRRCRSRSRGAAPLRRSARRARC